ncbi:MAG: hypothetical protein AAB368_15360, partial [bacterium]
MAAAGGGEAVARGEQRTHPLGGAGLRVDAQQRLGARGAEKEPGVVGHDELQAVAGVHAGDPETGDPGRRRGDDAREDARGAGYVGVDPTVGGVSEFLRQVPDELRAGLSR